MPSLLLIPLGVLLALVGYRALRGPQGRKLLSVMLLGAGLTLSALGSLNIPQALASIIPLELDNPEGGEIDLPVEPAQISNTSGVALKLGSLRIDDSCTSQPPPTTQCESGLILESGDSCAVDYDCKKVVFVTSTTQPGNLGGLGGADGICTDLAASAGLQNHGNYKAWLSDSVKDVASRFAPSDYEYRLVDGTVIASGFSDITDGRLREPIDLDEGGTQLPSDYLYAWTGTDKFGNLSDYSGNQVFDTCADWATSIDAFSGNAGYSLSIDIDWTESYLPSCDTLSRLYCFEQ
ncbi:hypothetical protein BST95_13260 [Halioglobus japonicus]|nr:hypothetical protein BST95_13260 [Halioglobus japonicus]